MALISQQVQMLTTTAEGPKSGLAITAEDNGKVTFGLDKATREKS